ncbi:transcription antitermination factor NusB [Trichloromonas sp.]|uniref:transcription antitermination factor NusB n=1 Tax=Trichloromonas sp. TaxID=3069249 RepID=UPI003D8176FA
MAKGMRRQGRELALKIIYSLQDQDTSIEEVLVDFWESFRFRDDVLGDPLDLIEKPVPNDVREFAEGLVRGVSDHLEQIDQMIDELSTNWALDRMARVDLSLLRLAAYELLCRPDVPASVAINEAIEIGKVYGTKDTPSFVNGILDKISRSCRPAGQ